VIRSLIDAHHHLWDLNGPLYHTQMVEHPESFLGDYAAIRRSYLPPEYRRDTALHNVVATVHVEAEVDRAQ
jgi:predicted TIM-barrel fold metal-dependent hydrolase